MLFARILLHKRIRSSPFSRTLWDAHLKGISTFGPLRPSVGNKKQGTCDYCKEIGKRLTREHILPRCYGGTILIRVCQKCNQKRGNSPVYPDFIRFIRENPALWREAKREACPMDTQAYGRFLNQVKHALQKRPKAKHLLA